MNITLKTAILKTGQTQRRVAKRARIDETRLSRIIRGHESATERERKRLARVLDASVDVLFGEEVSA